MNTMINKILDVDKVICKNIAKFTPNERGLLSQNILSQLRNFVEKINLYFYSLSQEEDIEDTYDNISRANKFVESNGSFRILAKFHKLLQISASHYTFDEDGSERLMLKYYEYLIRLKNLLKANNIDILENINDFPLNTDKTLNEYYEKIAIKLNSTLLPPKENEYKEKYYIQKIKPFFVKRQIYYEITFTIADDYTSKFDRIIAFSKHDILPNYAVKLLAHTDTIDILGQKMPILLIDDWDISIRRCELNHFATIFGKHSEISTENKEYKLLMGFLKNTHMHLLDLVQLESPYYDKIKNKLLEDTKVNHIFDLLDKCRILIQNKSDGYNVIKYLLYIFNNRIIKLQKCSDSCGLMSNLFLSYAAVPFDKIPFNTSLKGHNPKAYDLFHCIDTTDRTHELFARFIKNNTEQAGKLYTDLKDLKNHDELCNFIKKYNNSLYKKHRPLRQLEKFCNHVYINEYEKNAHEIIKKLQEMSRYHMKGYTFSTEDWMKKSGYQIDCSEKKKYLIDIFEKSSVALIYGSAGTGKSTLINHISHRFSNQDKIYLANTHPAIDNLRRKVTTSNTTFMTIAQFLSDNNTLTESFILFIDECSTVSNSDIVKILKKAKFDFLVLVGDVYQIESIIFGNWFNLSKEFVSKNSIFELNIPYRTKNDNLLSFWSCVRNLENKITEIMTKNNYSNVLDKTIFNKSQNDEIILCLNYDGLYGINNINKFLQVANPSPEILWRGQTYKANDPILFNDTKRFFPVIYNNLKGKIVAIHKEAEIIYFDIELDKAISEREAYNSNLEFIDNSDRGRSIVRFSVDKYENHDDDSELASNAVVPFQIAYAVSIHKAQGLEYDSVKIVITDEVGELINHNIFYTAITRARDKLKIYWSPETEHKILSNFKKKDSKKDATLLAQKYPELKF